MPTRFVISNVTRKFLQDSLERAVDDLLDDPDGMFPLYDHCKGGPITEDERKAQIVDYFSELSIVAADLETSIHDLIVQADRTDYEKKQLAELMGWSSITWQKGNQ